MDLNEQILLEAAQEIWSTTLEMQVTLAEADNNGHGWMTACLQLTGAWNGAVVLECSSPLARKAIAKMFMMEEGVCSPEELRDGLGELGNMIAGKVKSMVPGPTQQSLPSVTEGSDYQVSVPGSKLTHEVHLQSEGLPFRLRVLRKEG